MNPKPHFSKREVGFLIYSIAIKGKTILKVYKNGINKTED